LTFVLTVAGQTAGFVAPLLIVGGPLQAAVECESYPAMFSHIDISLLYSKLFSSRNRKQWPEGSMCWLLKVGTKLSFNYKDIKS